MQVQDFRLFKHRQSDKCHKTNRETSPVEGYVHGGKVWVNEVQPRLGVGIQDSGECTDLPISGTNPRPNGWWLAGCAEKHHARKVGLGEARDTTLMGEVRSQGVGNFLQGGGAGDSIVWVGNVVPFGVNGKEDRADAHGVTVNYHWEESKNFRRWDMGDSRGIRHTRGRGNPAG